MTEIVLKPCPFCGGEARLLVPDYPLIADCADAYASCAQCDVRGPSMLIDMDIHEASDWPDITAEAAKLWNTRTPPRITEEAVEAAWRALHDTASRSTTDMARAALTAALPLMGGDRGVEIGFPEGSENHKLAMEHNRDR